MNAAGGAAGKDGRAGKPPAAHVLLVTYMDILESACLYAEVNAFHMQAELQAKAAELESLLRAERNAQRDLKLVLAAAERQSQSDACDKSELAAKCARALLPCIISERD